MVKPDSYRNPIHILMALVASEVEVIRARDPELSAALDSPPPVVKQTDLTKDGEAIPFVQRGLVYRVLRKIYRTLLCFEALQPVLQEIRSRVARFHFRRDAQRSKTVTFPLMFPNIVRTFTIAFTMRSGSNEICNLLARNGLGSPNEFFQTQLPPHPHNLVLDSFACVVKQNQIDGVFGSKMSYEHRAALDEQLRSVAPGYRRIDDLLPQHRWVWLIRRDKILQAVSWCRAETNNAWTARQSNISKTDEFSYDFFHMLSRVMMIYIGELAWETYFQENGIHPLIVVYEDFFHDLDRQLPRLINYLGGLPPLRTAIDKGTTFDIQRDARSYAVRQRFVSDLARIGEKKMAEDLGEPYHRWFGFFFERGWRGRQSPD